MSTKTTPNHSLLPTPVDAITFDCDGTLSAIEGIDELARMQGVGAAVENITQTAMAKTGLNEKLYQQRLDLVKPSRTQVLEVGKKYIAHQTLDTHAVINLFQRLNKKVYILSAGLHPAVAVLGNFLSIPEENIFAVPIFFDAQGHYLDFDHTSPLIADKGKEIIGEKIKTQHPRIIHIGDGLNDLSIQASTVRFIGYGGVFYRENIAKMCEYYVTHSSMAAILPLCLTEEETKKLSSADYALYEKGCHLVETRFIASQLTREK